MSELRVWWIPQIPMEPFYVSVNTVAEGVLILRTLAQYDLFQLEHHIKPDYANTGGLCVLENGEWFDWVDEDGRTMDELLEAQLLKEGLDN